MKKVERFNSQWQWLGLAWPWDCLSACLQCSLDGSPNYLGQADWMNTVKIVFAFIELALMVKFLSNADLVMHWGILKREVFFAIWILISLATALYLFGILRFHGEPEPGNFRHGGSRLVWCFLALRYISFPG